MTATGPEELDAALRTVIDPCCRERGISVVDMGLVRHAELVDGTAQVELMLTSGWCPFQADLSTTVSDALAGLAGVESVEVHITLDEVWTPARLSDGARQKLRFLPDPVAVADPSAYLASHDDPTR